MSYIVEKDWMTDTGLRAVVIYITDMGHRCGYVGVPSGHPLHGIEYNKTTQILKLDPNRSTEKMSPIQVLCAAGEELDDLNSPEYVFEVHGGLTYSGGNGKYPIESDLWWFGYDCAHAGDLRDPVFLESLPEDRRWLYESYDGLVRTLEYCTKECDSLARQITEATLCTS